MTPLIPFALSALGAVLSELVGEDSKSAEYGASPLKSKVVPGQLLSSATIVKRNVVPTRFTKGANLTSVARARKAVAQSSSSLSEESDPSQDTGTEEEEEQEEQIDPREVVERQIEQELLIDSLADEVLDDMELGYDPDLEDSLPTDKQFLDKYEPLDQNEEESYGGVRTQSIFASGTGWGIRSKR